jgi:hypothetical protein
MHAAPTIVIELRVVPKSSVFDLDLPQTNSSSRTYGSPFTDRPGIFPERWCLLSARNE